MPRFRCFALYICGLIAVQVLHAQPSAPGPVPDDPPFAFFEYFGEEAGIDGPVRLFRQDRQGYLWCAVEHKGLLRFDGARFEVFRNDPDDPASLPDNDIRDILEDREGYLWLTAQTGVIRVDPMRQRFDYVPMERTLPCLSLLEGRNGRIWVGTAGGLAYYDPRRDSLVFYPGAGIRNGFTGVFFPNSSFDYYFGLAEDSAGTIWAGATMFEVNGPGLTALLAIRPGQPEIVFYPPDAKLNVPRRLQTPSFSVNQENETILLGGEGMCLLEFRPDKRVWNRVLPQTLFRQYGTAGYITASLPEKDGAIWVAGDWGVANVRPTGFSAFSPAPEKVGGYRAGPCNTIFRDREGTLWFGSDKRISRLDPFRQQFPLHSPLPAGFDAQAIAEYAPSGELLFAEWGKNNRFRIMAWNPRTGNLRQAEQVVPYHHNDVPVVHQLFVAPDRRIWVLLNRGLAWLDPATLRLSFPDMPVANNPQYGTAGLWARRMTADASGNLWLATFGSGIVRYDPATRAFWRPPELPVLQGARREFNEYLYSVFVDSAGQVFLGENGTGLEVWNPARQTRVLHGPQAKNNHSLSGLFIRCITADSQGDLWLGTENGLCRYRPGMPTDSAFERVKHLSETVFDLVPDHLGRLWIKTLKGLACYDPHTGAVKKFGRQEGLILPISDFTPLFKSADGQIWLGDDLHFNPEKIRLSPPAAIPLITGFRIYDQPVPLPVPTNGDSMILFPEMTLQPNQEVFTVNIGALGFTAPEQTRLLYRLGDDDAWVEAGTQRAFTFNRLPGGRYRFQIKAIAPDGSDTGRTAVLPLRVIPPFYRAAWFWVLCAFVFAAGIYALFRYREYQRLQQEKLRLRIARDLHDEMGSTLSSISILSDAALRQLQRDIDRTRFGTIGDRTRQVMEAMSDIVWSVNPQNDNMTNVLQRMKEFAVELFEPQDIALHFDAGETVKTLNLPMEQRKDFYLLFKEAVNNAAKYSSARDVWVTVRAENGGLLLEVRDNGRGFDLEAVRRGNGLWNMQRRAERMGGRLVMESTPGTGTRLSMTVLIK